MILDPILGKSEFRRMKKNVNLGDVAKALGVSRTTVSLVMSGHPRISKNTARRVLKCVKALGYQPNLLARTLSTGRSNLIGVIVPDSSNPFFAEVLRGAEDSARKGGWHLLLNNGSYSLQIEEERIKDLLGLRIEGLLACPAFIEDGDARRGLWAELAEQSFPLVFLNRQITPPMFHQVGVDSASGILQVVTYLFEQGHRRIGLIVPTPDILPVRQRMDEVRKQMGSFGLNLADDMIAGGAVSFAGGHTAAGQLWEKARIKPSAVFALTDTMALGALNYFHEHAVPVPGLVSVIGMDGIPYAKFSLIPLTSVEASLFEVGAAAVKVLQDIINDEATTKPRSTMLPMHLNIRASSGPAPGR